MLRQVASIHQYCPTARFSTTSSMNNDANPKDLANLSNTSTKSLGEIGLGPMDRTKDFDTRIDLEVQVPLAIPQC